MLAAREDQIHEENAHRLQARLIAEGANGPTSIEADAILAERGIPVLPDVLTNAGGVTVSYFEWVQDLGRLFWDREEIRAKLADKLGDAFDRVWTLSEEKGMTLRTAALVARDSRGRRRRSAREGSILVPAASATRWSPSRSRSTRRRRRRRRASTSSEPDVRAVLVCESGRFVGVVTRKTLVARGRRGRPGPARRRRLGEIAEPPNFTLDADVTLDEAFAQLEERDLERVPVSEDGRLVGVLSRAVVQRRLAEDEPPVELEAQQQV